MNGNEARYYLTVDWCGIDKRGVFCDRKGGAFCHIGGPMDEDETFKILGAFSLILAPEWHPLTKAEMAEYKVWYPLPEYSNQYGVALREAA